MAIQIKQLGSGTITAPGVNPDQGQKDLGTMVADGKTRIVKSIRLINAAASAPVYINMYLSLASTDVLISPVNLYLVSGGMYLDETEITMEKDYKIKVVLGAGSGGPLHYTVSGIERDV